MPGSHRIGAKPVKNIFAFLVVVFLFFALSGNALARLYDWGHLNMALFDPDANERQYDFGHISTDFNLSDSNVLLGTVNLTDMLQINYWSYSVGGMGYSGTYEGDDHIFAVTSPTAPGTTGWSGAPGFINGAASIDGMSYPEGVDHYAGAPSGFVDKMNDHGNYAGFNASPALGRIYTSTIDELGYVDAYLYYYVVNMETWDWELNEGASTPYQAMVRLEADGDVILNPEIADQCPDDPNKIEPGICGCGVPDTDTNMDGEPDCVDTDDDGDAMPDIWEIQYGLNPMLAADAGQDADSDGFSNFQEYASGTIPNDAGSQPIRPFATVNGLEVLAEEPVSLPATATPGSNAIESFTWTQTQGPIVSLSQTDDLPNGTSTVSFTAPAVGTGSTETLAFEVTVTDDVGIASVPTGVTVTVQSSGQNNPPGVPSVNFPPHDSEVVSCFPELSVNNAVDIDGNSLSYEFQVARDEGFSQIVGEVSGITETQDATTWLLSYPVENLQEDQVYWWRVRACDCNPATDLACDCDNSARHSEWTTPAAQFFVNTQDQPPEGLAIAIPPSPQDGAEVTTDTVTLAVFNATDPDGQILKYRFTIDTEQTLNGPNAQTVIQSEDASGVTSWVVPDLDENTLYFWMVTVLEYDFELYADRHLTQFVDGLSGQVNRLLATATAHTPLEDGHTYYWRSQAYDGEFYSAWMPTANFTVSANGDSSLMAVVTDLPQIAYAGLTETQVYSIDQSTGSLTGLSVTCLTSLPLRKGIEPRKIGKK